MAETSQTGAPYVPAKQLETAYPLIDNDPHFKRVMAYTRRTDYVEGAAWFAAGPALMWFWEKRSPSFVGKGGFAPMMRLTIACSATAAFFRVYQKSTMRLYGFTENEREVDMDMREMVAKIKKGETLYGTSELTPYMQGVAARNSRYSALLLHIIPWFNFVNHPQVLYIPSAYRSIADLKEHGVDTAKYYREAERQLADEAAQGAHDQ